MNKSPESFERDLRRERVLESAAQAPADAALAADWRLKNRLRGLGPEPLPDAVRRRVRRRTSARVHAPWLGAIAAALVIAVALPVVQNGPDPAPAGRPASGDVAELGLALNAFRAAGRRALTLAGREVTRSLLRPDLGLASMPYANLVRESREPRRAPNPTEPPRQENRQ